LNPRLSRGARFYRLLAILPVCSILLSSGPIARAGEAEALILHTNNVTGYLFPCPT
jgi:hypothetical protein